MSDFWGAERLVWRSICFGSFTARLAGTIIRRRRRASIVEKWTEVVLPSLKTRTLSERSDPSLDRTGPKVGVLFSMRSRRCLNRLSMSFFLAASSILSAFLATNGVLSRRMSLFRTPLSLRYVVMSPRSLALRLCSMTCSVSLVSHDFFG